MSFSPDWLALREGPDHRARDHELLKACAAALPADAVAVLDLGCGTGSNLRASAPMLAPRQSWRLVDHDEALLAAARARLIAWADDAEHLPGGLRLSAYGKTIEVSFVAADLRPGLAPLLTARPDLVTAAALFDLVSADWLAGFAADLAAARLPLYGALTYDGVQEWLPACQDDAAIFAAFNAHQASDKGFGPAAGPLASTLLADQLRMRGYDVSLAPSPWRLGEAERALIAELAEGTARAAAETGRVSPRSAETWARARRAAASCLIGHADLWSSPRA